MGGTPSAPSVQEQTEGNNSQNMWAAMVNNTMGNPDTVNPYGSTTSRQTGSVAYTDPYTGRSTNIPRFTQTTALSPEQQQLYNKETQGKNQFADMALNQMGNVSSKLNTPIDYGKFEGWRGYDKAPTLQEADPEYQKKIEDNMMASFNRAAQPTYDAQDAQYAARGMGAPGSQYGYNVGNQRSDAMAEAVRQGYNVAGGEARAAAEGINKTRQADWQNRNAIADQGNAMRTSQIAEAQGERSNILNELLAMFGQAQSTAPQAPAWQGSQVNPFDVAGAMQTEYTQKQQAAASRNAAIAGIVGSVGKLAFV
jgi:hypothetical protein